ncbi:MAG: hypothetical protein R3C68_01680 [Myxococcota bacterium]
MVADTLYGLSQRTGDALRIDRLTFADVESTVIRINPLPLDPPTDPEMPILL